MFRFIFIFLISSLILHAKVDQSTLVYLNDIRQHTGLTPFTLNKNLSKAARSHAKYLIRQHKSGHYEKKGYKGFTGTTPSKRVVHAGYASKMVMENVSTNTKTQQASIDTLMAAIYHRFVFLTFDKDEIGIGKAKNPKSKILHSANVYDLGNIALREACKKTFNLKSGMLYTTNVCKESKKKIPESYFKKKLTETRRKNPKIILYPYNGQKEIHPAFYNESPDPLPNHKVSGYPVSVQFNTTFYKKITILSFRLFGNKGKEIKKYKILNYTTDINHRFSKLQFAFMPLKRLEYGTTYSVKFKATADGKPISKNWKFTTKTLKGTYYKITKKQTIIKVRRGEKIILYFEPRSPKDILKSVQHKGQFKLKYLDPNTLKITLPNKPLRGIVSLKTGQREVILK